MWNKQTEGRTQCFIDLDKYNYLARVCVHIDVSSQWSLGSRLHHTDLILAIDKQLVVTAVQLRPWL